MRVEQLSDCLRPSPFGAMHAARLLLLLGTAAALVSGQQQQLQNVLKSEGSSAVDWTRQIGSLG